jgi:hypothetical protein
MAKRKNGKDAVYHRADGRWEAQFGDGCGLRRSGPTSSTSAATTKVRSACVAWPVQAGL